MQRVAQQRDVAARPWRDRGGGLEGVQRDVPRVGLGDQPPQARVPAGDRLADEALEGRAAELLRVGRVGIGVGNKGPE